MTTYKKDEVYNMLLNKLRKEVKFERVSDNSLRATRIDQKYPRKTLENCRKPKEVSGSVPTSLSQADNNQRFAAMKKKFGITDEYDELEFQGLLTRMYGTPSGRYSAKSNAIFTKFTERVNEKILAGEKMCYGVPISYNEGKDLFYISKQTHIDLILKGKYAKQLGYE